MSIVSDPIEAPPLRWGILGAGHIASRFVTAVQPVSYTHLTLPTKRIV